MVRRIALLFEFGTLNGGEHSMLAALDHLLPGVEVIALAPGGEPLRAALLDRGIRHVPFTLRDESDRRLPRSVALDRLAETLRAVTPDIVHANSLAMGRLTGAIADRLDCPSITHLRDIIRLSHAAIDDLNRNRLLLAVSNATKSFHVAQGLAAERTRVLWNGVDCQRFQPRPATGDLTRELGIPSDRFLIATIGQIGLRKGQDVLADAAVLVARNMPDAHYLLVGERYSRKQESVDYERNVIEHFERAGLASRLHCLGYRDDIPFLMNEVDLLVHPAHQEPLGRVLLEAAASGLPVIATRVGGTDEIFEDRVSAQLVPPNRPDLLAAGMIELYRDADQRARLARAARTRAEMAFDIKIAARRLESIWQETGSRFKLG